MPLSEPISEVVQFSSGDGLTGFLVSPSIILQYRGSMGASTIFALNGVNHTLTIKEINLDSVVLVIQSDPVEVEVIVGESKLVSIDADPENDVIVRVNSIENGVVLLTVEKAGRVSPKMATLTAIILIIVVISCGGFIYRKKLKTMIELKQLETMKALKQLKTMIALKPYKQ